MTEGFSPRQAVLFAELEDEPRNPAGRSAEADDLSAQQSAFVDHYLECLNATEAAKRAGYSPATARQQGSRLLSNVVVMAELRRRLVDIRQAHRQSVDGVLEQLGKLAYADTRKLYDDTGAIKPPHAWPDDVAPRIAGVETEERWTILGEDLNDAQRIILMRALRDAGLGQKPGDKGQRSDEELTSWELSAVKTVKVKVWNPNDALTSIARYLKMLSDGRSLGDGDGILLDQKPIDKMPREELLERVRKLRDRAA